MKALPIYNSESKNNVSIHQIKFPIMSPHQNQQQYKFNSIKKRRSSYHLIQQIQDEPPNNKPLINKNVLINQST